MKVAIFPGDGIGPEITAAALRVMEAAGARFDTREIALGEALYTSGHSSGIGPDTWDTLAEADALFKGPITTPLGSGYKSLNVTLRKTLGLFANVRPCRSLHPAVSTLHPKLDIVIVRENEEDLYAGIEHRQTHEVYQTLKLVSRPGTERIIRYAFEYARDYGRKKVTCMTKDNIMKLTDGLFHAVFDEIAAQYPDIANEHMIIDIGTARVATRPRDFDVVVTPNLYGDILSDVAAMLTGSLGMLPSASLGAPMENGRPKAMYEPVHGSAPDIAGEGKANPCACILSFAMALRYSFDMGEEADRLEAAVEKVLADGVRTGDLLNEEGVKPVSTSEMGDAVIAALDASL